MIDPNRLTFFDRIITKIVEKVSKSAPGDFRDWDKIRAWGQIVLAG